MGKTKDLGHLAHIVAYNSENHITVPAGITMHTNQLVASQAWVTTALGSYALSSSLGSYVPTSRTITINGTSYDLSANRSWDITSMIYPAAGIPLSTGSAWGTSITNNSANWNTAYGWGNHASAGYLTSYTETSTLANVTARGGNTSTPVVFSGNMTAWNTTTPGVGVGSIQIGAANGTANTGGAITFAARDGGGGSNAQAGIYIVSDGNYGTRMYLATTDSYAAGSKTAISINEGGLVNITRGALQQGGNQVLHAGNYTSYAVPASGGFTRTGNLYNIGIFTAGQNTNGTAAIDAYGSYAYFGCNTASNGIRIDASGNINVGATFYASTYRGNANVGGTGEATWHPAGIYCGSTMWQYGDMYKSNTPILGLSLIRLNNGFEISQGGSDYGHFNSWVRLGGHYGIFAPNHNNAHFYPNSNTYGSWKILGSRNGWNGIHFGEGTGMTLMMNETEFGFHREAHGWYARFTNGRYYGTADSANYVHWDNVGSKPGNLNYWNTWYGSAYLGSDGNLYMGFLGRWLSDTINQDVRSGSNPSFGALYASNWFRAQGDCGLYSQDYGGHIRRSLATSYGNWETFGYERNGWGGFAYLNNYHLNLMMNTSGDHGFYQENGNGWTLFYNRGNNCWGIGTDNTYSGDGFRCVKYGSAQFGWTTWSDRRAKENIATITGALDAVLAMRGVYYNYIKDEAKVKRVGFIAQELMEVLPEAVRYAEEIDEYNVNYDQIVSVLAEAIKEQNAKITRLETLVEQLTNN